MNIYIYVPPEKKVILNPYIKDKYTLHSHETEVVTMLRFERCRDIESGVRNLSTNI